MEERAKYPSYNALARVAMLKGVPLVAAILIAFFSLVTGTLGALFLGPGGLLLAAIGVPLFFYCRDTCKDDDQALRITWLEFKCWLGKLNAKYYGGTYTLAPMKYGRRKHVYKRYFKDQAAGHQ
jgi:type IV secretion system protein VirB3